MNGAMTLRTLSPKYGKGVSEIAGGGFSITPSTAEIVGKLRTLFTSPAYSPPVLPDVAVKLLELSQRPEVEVDQVVLVLEKDAVLAGRVLKLVQSPIYAGQSAIRSLRQAIVRLGLSAMRNCVLEVALNVRVFRARGYGAALEGLQRHGLATAYLCRLVAKWVNQDAEFAFLCGLLHDVGIAGSLLGLADERGGNPPPLADIWAAVETIHEEAGATMCRLWKLPEDVTFVVGNHHRISSAGRIHAVAATIVIAQQLADDLGFGLASPLGDTGSRGEADRAAVREAARSMLDLGDKKLDAIRAAAKEATAEMGSHQGGK